MRRLFVSKKTGFRNLNTSIPILIRDQRGIIFYDSAFLKNQPTKFNMPQGLYFIESGSFTPLSSPVKYRLVSLPYPERRYPNPFNFNIKFGRNPNKCSIIWAAKTILFDDAFKEKSLPICDFVLCHEFSHQRYKTEKYADLFAGNLMKIMGYNPSQIGTAPLESLSDKQIERQTLMVDKLINANG